MNQTEQVWCWKKKIILFLALERLIFKTISTYEVIPPEVTHDYKMKMNKYFQAHFNVENQIP